MGRTSTHPLYTAFITGGPTGHSSSGTAFCFFLFFRFIGSIVDVDHFLAAETFTLHAATHLTQRPKGHNLMMCGLLPLVAKLGQKTKRMILRKLSDETGCFLVAVRDIFCNLCSEYCRFSLFAFLSLVYMTRN